MTKKLIISAIFLILIIFAVSCDKDPVKEDPNQVYEELLDYFTEVFDAFNNCEYDKYLEYFDMGEETEMEIKGRLLVLSQYFSTKKNIEQMFYEDTGNGTYLVQILYLDDIEDYVNMTASQQRGVDTFTIARSGKSFAILQIVNGESVQVGEITPLPETDAA